MWKTTSRFPYVSNVYLALLWKIQDYNFFSVCILLTCIIVIIAVIFTVTVLASYNEIFARNVATSVLLTFLTLFFHRPWVVLILFRLHNIKHLHGLTYPFSNIDSFILMRPFCLISNTDISIGLLNFKQTSVRFSHKRLHVKRESRHDERVADAPVAAPPAASSPGSPWLPLTPPSACWGPWNIDRSDMNMGSWFSVGI